jgi:hypothetical protein
VNAVSILGEKGVGRVLRENEKAERGLRARMLVLFFIERGNMEMNDVEMEGRKVCQ